jgi:hypothetical protein
MEKVTLKQHTVPCVVLTEFGQTVEDCNEHSDTGTTKSTV